MSKTPTIHIKHDENTSPIGMHTFSFCDVRHPRVKELESEIESTSEHYRNAAKRCYNDYLMAKIREDFVAASELQEALQTIRRKGHALLQSMYREMQSLTLVKQETVKNIIPTEGRNVLARWLTGDNTYDAANGANYGSLGSSNTTPANGDTQLGTETYRKATSSVAVADNVAYLSNFYTASEFTGTIEEAGWHIDGTASANSGQLFSHFLTTTQVKTSVETLTVESEITFS